MIFLFLILLLPAHALAVPYFAVVARTSCSHCHLNPTGGGLRNEHGVFLMSEFTLRQTASLFEKDYKGKIGPYVGLGGDLKARHQSTLESPTSNSFQIPQGTLYLAASPNQYATLYLDTDLANLANREAFGLIHKLPADGWIKFGRFNLPYGLRLPDDSSFIRNDLGLGFSNQDLGVEVGLEPGPFTLATSFTNGVGGGTADDNGAKAISSLSEWRLSIFRMGASFLYNSASTTRTFSGGSFTGLKLWEMALLGEFDLQRVLNRTDGTERTVWAGFGEASYPLVKGLYLKGVYDDLDDNRTGSGRRQRLSGGLEFFPIPHLEATLLYRYRRGVGLLGDDQIMAQLHGFF